MITAQVDQYLRSNFPKAFSGDKHIDTHNARQLYNAIKSLSGNSKWIVSDIELIEGYVHLYYDYRTNHDVNKVFDRMKQLLHD